MDKILQKLYKTVADLDGIPQEGAYNLRADGVSIARNSTKNITITSKTEVSGIDIHIKDGTRGEKLHIPVALKAAISERVFNDFHIGENCEVTIVAGCGIHSDCADVSQHDGVHAFYVGKNSTVRYIEKHYGTGAGTGARILNPETVIEVGEGSVFETETVQIEGVDSASRITRATLGAKAKLVVREKLMTHGAQKAVTKFSVELNGAESGADVVSRSVAKNNSQQEFIARVAGNNACIGRVECDAIIMDNARVSATPEIFAHHVDAQLVHEAAIGKIAGEQIIKLTTLGLTEKQAEQEIINGFLK
ncbi:MAG: SufD family Fe-S cluster assembly protein [Firmicutes bacterium]|nr:SufD family Fe-S cluster assembly protein [Bacillota bacterium]